MEKLYFITSNKAKVASLQEYFAKADLNIEIEGKNLSIVEPQANSVAEVSRIKALSAYNILKAPLVVEDGGFTIDALNGFPGVYTRFILDSIGVDGILKLMEGVENRKCQFISTTTFVNAEGEVSQFHRPGGSGEIALQRSTVSSEYMWSDIWYIFYDTAFKKTLSEFSKEELFQLKHSNNETDSLTFFVKWLKEELNKK